MHVLFANTGVQCLCLPMRGGSRYTSAQVGYGWQRLRCGSGEEGQQSTVYPYIQWQIIQSGTSKLFLAVDTTCGDPDVGYFCDAGSLTKDFMVRLDGILDLSGKPLKGVQPIEICIRPAAATAGTGDVLAGMVSGLLAQGLEPLVAAAAGIHIGGTAAARFVEGGAPQSLVATDLIDTLPDVLRSLS